MTVEILPQSVTVSAQAATGAIVILPQTVDVEADPKTLDVALQDPVVKEIVGGDPYEGSYTITPTAETQSIPTAGKILTQNLTVNPIPSNYGLITWSGSILTVS